MLALADEPVDPARQAVLLYCWTPELHGLREELVRAGVEVGEVTYPFYMPAGELSVVDPDGYVLLTGQAARRARGLTSTTRCGTGGLYDGMRRRR